MRFFGNSQETDPVVLSLRDFGDLTSLEPDIQTTMRLALEAAGEIEGPVILDIPRGSYHFYPHAAIRKPYHITNTASEEENPDVTKTIGVLMKDLHQVMLEGNESLFIFHGKQTMLVLDGCTDIEIRNLHFDYAAPTVTEMTVDLCGESYLEACVHSDSHYELVEHKLEWVGEGWRFRKGPMQLCDTSINATWRIDNWLERVIHTEELGPHRLRFHFENNSIPDITPGTIVQMRDGIRDQVGVFISQSSNVTITDVGIHFMHGLGVVGQFSENLTFERLDLSPRLDTGRTVTGFADFIHLSGCKGNISIRDSHFAGSHDDAINVHGTYLRIVKRMGPHQLLVRFMHPQTYGFSAFFPGDEIAFVNADTLLSYSTSRITAVEIQTARELLLTLEKPAPEGIGEQDVLENVTWTPEVEIVGNHFSKIPTRGVLVTTPRSVVIRDNTFERTYMSAVLVAADANSWFESGAVTDMSITDNRFIECGFGGQPVIQIEPENAQSIPRTPVHRNIKIIGNLFELTNEALLSARSTEGLLFRNNEILLHDTHSRERTVSLEENVKLVDCSGMDITCNMITNNDMNLGRYI